MVRKRKKIKYPKFRGVTLDSGVLIASERRKTSKTLQILYDYIYKRDPQITIPTIVLAEWWTGKPGQFARIINSEVKFDPLTEQMAKTVGTVYRKCKNKGPSLTDVVVMASANSRKDFVYTNDKNDFQILEEYFKDVEGKYF